MRPNRGQSAISDRDFFRAAEHDLECALEYIGGTERRMGAICEIRIKGPMNSPATYPCIGRGASRSLVIRTDVTAGDPGTAPSFPLASRTQHAWESGIGEVATPSRRIRHLTRSHQRCGNSALGSQVDGWRNTVQQIDVTADPSGEENPFQNAFRAVVTELKTEKQGRANLNLASMRTWKVVNPSVQNALGQPVGYKFFPGDNATPLASKNAWWRKRAGFVNHHVWVTPFSEEERYAAGECPNQSAGGDGLVRWTEQDRNIANTDVVFWYTFGHTHIPRPEDYPVMPVAYIGFLLKPNGFFNLNPANDLPSSATPTNGHRCCHPK